jgi:hypothetical protein
MHHSLMVLALDFVSHDGLSIVSGKLAVAPCAAVVSFELCGSEKNRGTNSTWN